MIEFRVFDDFHGPHSIEIQERIVYIHLVIIIEKVRNDLFIRDRFSYEVGP